MSVTGEQFGVTHSEQDRLTRGFIGFGSAAAAVFGLVGVIFCILALAGMNPVTYAAVATVLIGISLLIEGASVVARSNKLGSESAVQEIGWAIGSEMAVQSLVGLAGIMLGILAWVGIQPFVLMAVAAIIMGGGLLIESSSEAILGRLHLLSYKEKESVEQITHQAVEASAGADFLFGIGAIVLGIMALVGYAPLTLILVAMLTLGIGVLLGGSALASRFLGAFR